MLIGTRLCELLVPTEANKVAYRRGFIRAGYRLTDAETKEVDRFGHELYFANNLVDIIEEGKLLRAGYTRRDISRRRRAEVRRLAFRT